MGGEYLIKNKIFRIVMCGSFLMTTLLFPTIAVKAVEGGAIQLNTVVEKAVTAPQVPTIGEVTDKSAIVYGQAEVGTTVEAKVGSNVIGKTVTQESGHGGYNNGNIGNYVINIPVQKAGVEITVTARDSAGNISVAAKTRVKDATAPNTPQVNDFNCKSTIITGNAEAGSTVKAKIYGELFSSGKADENGYYKLIVPSAGLKVGINLDISATDAAGNESVAIRILVKDIAAPSKGNTTTTVSQPKPSTVETGTKAQDKPVDTSIVDANKNNDKPETDKEIAQSTDTKENANEIEDKPEVDKETAQAATNTKEEFILDKAENKIKLSTTLSIIAGCALTGCIGTYIFIRYKKMK